VVAPAIVVVIAAAIAVGLVLHGSSGAGTYKLSPLQRQENVARGQAAAWVAQQVSTTSKIACDQPTCSALASHGFPARNLTVLSGNSGYPRNCTLVLQTAYVRSLFGESLGNQIAPIVVATFGKGGAQIAVRVVAPQGAAAYRASLAADLTYWKQNLAAILGGSRQIAASAAARTQMATGLVDPRLILAITALAGQSHPLDIVDFGNLGEGAITGVPFRYADLAEDGPAAHMSNPAYLRWMLSVLNSLQGPLRALRTTRVQLPGGVTVLRVEYSAPSPLDVLAPPQGGN
jgi:hypothetical protein